MKRTMSATSLDISALAKRYKNIPFIISQKETLSYGRFMERVTHAKRVLEKSGLQAGDRVVITTATDTEFIVIFFAILLIGGLAVPVNPKLPPDVMQKMISGIYSNKIISSNEFFTDLDLPGIEYVSFEGISNQVADLFDHEDSDHRIPFDRHVTIIFTSGSTSVPRAALHTFGNHYFSALGANQNISLAAGDRWLLSLPLFHVGGLAILFRTLISGASVVIPENELSINQNIEKYDVSHISLVATQLYRLLNDPTPLNIFHQLKAILVGGGPIPDKLLEQASNLSLPVYTSYGSTEMSSQITTTLSGDTLPYLFTAGKVLPFREIRIAVDGEIEVRGKTLFKGYVEGEKINTGLNRHEWFATGDIGKIDNKGYLTLIGRKDNMYISGGENVFPEEVEHALLRLEQIEQAIVVPVPHDEFGNITVALVKMKNHSELNTSFIESALNKLLPGYKIPKIIYRWPEHLETGLKPNRAQLTIYAKRLSESGKEV